MVNCMYLFSESRCPWFLSIEGLSGLRGDLEHHGRRSFETRAYSLRCADLIVWEKKKRNSECEGDLGRNLMVVFCSERSRKLLGKGYRICEFLPRGLRLAILVRAGQPASQIILTGYWVGSDPVIWRFFCVSAVIESRNGSSTLLSKQVALQSKSRIGCADGLSSHFIDWQNNEIERLCFFQFNYRKVLGGWYW